MSTRYSKDHEYARPDGDIATIGISNFAQEQLGDIVFVELPSVGAKFVRGDEAAVVESVKAASEIYSPLTGMVTEVNEMLTEDPGLINTDPEGSGWIFRLKIDDPREFDELMDETAYAELAK